MAKRLSEKDKKEIVELFVNGKTVEELSNDFKCTKFTITRNLKLNLDEKEYKELTKKNKKFNKNAKTTIEKIPFESKTISKLDDSNSLNEEAHFDASPFMEIAPLNYDVDNLPQKDLSSIPISEIEFPKIVYMVVDKTIELETKYLKDYPDWRFLSEDELNRKTIEIYEDMKIAKRFCNRDQKVLKVPNTNVFKIVAPLLISRGISRIVSSEKLIAL